LAARAGLVGRHKGGAPGDLLGDYLQRVRGAPASGTLGALRAKLSGYETLARDAALHNRAAADAARPGSVGAAYAAFAPTPPTNPAFQAGGYPARRARSNYGGPDDCGRCTAGSPETAEHALLDCPAYALLRADARFASLFAQPLPAGAARWPAFVRTHDQQTLASFVHAFFEDRSQQPR
jgi:hypothetical protein